MFLCILLLNLPYHLCVLRLKCSKSKHSIMSVVYFDQRTYAYACVHMVENNEKRLKIVKEILFSSYARETHERFMQKHEEISSFLAFRSDSQTLVDTQKLVAPQQYSLNLDIFVREPLVSMIKTLI